MKKDAHYYALLALARSVGIEKDTAQKIAYASQFVDDAKINKITLAADNPSDILSELDNSNKFINAATCHDYFKVDTFNYGAMTNNTSAFHFVPGCDEDTFVKKMKCKKESPIIMDILKKAIKEGDPIKLGITLHAYADTFSHQGFSGIVSKVNDIEDLDTFNIIESENKVKKFLMEAFNDVKHAKKDKFMPAYGHGQVFQYPDLPYLKWKYCYDSSIDFSKDYEETRIDNRKRFKNAFEKIKEHLIDFKENNHEHRDQGVQFEDDDKFYDLLLAKKKIKKRIKDWQEFLVKNDLLSSSDDHILEYDEDLWLEESFADFEADDFCSRIVEDVHVSDDFLESNWYKYYQGTQWYKDLFFKAAEDNGLNIPNNYI